MEEYEADITLTVKIEAPNKEDAEEMLMDHFGLGSCGEGIEVTSIEYVVQ